MYTFRENCIRIKNAFLYKILMHCSIRSWRIWAFRNAGYHIGEQSKFASGITITQVFVNNRGSLWIGDRVNIAANVTFILMSYPTTSKLRTILDHSIKPVRIEDDVWIGCGAIILNGITIGKCSIVGAGSVVMHDVPPYSVVAGNPARVIKTMEKI